MKIISPRLALYGLTIICTAVLFIDLQPVFGSNPPTQCQAVSLMSGGCPNPPTDNGYTYPTALPRGVTLINVKPYAGGGSGGFYAPGLEGGQEYDSISNADTVNAAAAAEHGNIAIIVLYNGPATNLSFVVLQYLPLSGTWNNVMAVNNSGLTLKQLQTLMNSPDFIQKVLDAIHSANATINLNGGGGGEGTNPDGSNNSSFIEIDGVTVCHGNSTQIGGTSFVASPPDGSIQLGKIIATAQVECP